MAMAKEFCAPVGSEEIRLSVPLVASIFHELTWSAQAALVRQLAPRSNVKMYFPEGSAANISGSEGKLSCTTVFSSLPEVASTG